MLATIKQFGGAVSVGARIERPVENCELTPNAYVQIKGGNIDNVARGRLQDPNNFYYTFTWKRGPGKTACCNPSCQRSESFEPLQWCKPALGGPELICNVCTSTGYPAHESSFCTTACFVSAWKEHAKRHSIIRKLSSISETVSTPPNEPEDIKVVADAAKLNADDEWQQISDQKSYTPTAEDIGCRLRIDITAISTADNTLIAGPIALFTEVVLTAPKKSPIKRNLHAIPHERTAVSGAVRFRIVSYNILAEKYATRQAYPYCDSWSLSWPFRRKIIFEELEEIAGDIVCLQEVQADHYESDINPFMSQLGYDGIYKQKSHLATYGKLDGCATFWKKSKFIMTEHYGLDFNNLALQEAAQLGFDENEARRYMNRLNRDNIAQIVVLESLSRPNNNRARPLLCVVNTHILSNNQLADVKLWQTMNLIREVQQFVTQRDLALMICGDFNSEPMSAVYDFVINHALMNDHPELYNEERMQILPDLNSIGHGLDLESVMATATGTEPIFTNYTANFKGTLDYIFYTPGRLKILAVTNVPDEHEVANLSGEGGLPCACFPSDHVWLSCDVAIVTAASGGSILNNDMNNMQLNSNGASGNGAGASAGGRSSSGKGQGRGGGGVQGSAR